ncbi:MAG: malonyl-ACP O-methyltransferase BioC [Gammaproteobacteria bacterium]|nr:MAG: malonyl-ACP O-methyltransferase BioC [Gammaproteobacteria bacterium]
MLNKHRISKDFSKAADTYDAAAIVQHEICDRALERLQMLKLEPYTILDIGSGTGRSVRGLQVQFPNSHVIASDVAMSMLLQTNQMQPPLQPTASIMCCEAEHLSVKDESVDLIFSTSTFQWCGDLNQVLIECARILKQDGVLVFSTFGPDTLKELRQSWARVDQRDHVHQFIDMHHIGDLLMANHYADPVVDMEVITIEYKQARQLLRDLKDTGSRGKFGMKEDNFSNGLMGKKKFHQFEAAYEHYRQKNGLLPASYEVIYGYARKLTSNKDKMPVSEVRIPINQIK